MPHRGDPGRARAGGAQARRRRRRARQEEGLPEEVETTEDDDEGIGDLALAMYKLNKEKNLMCAFS